MFGKKMLFLNSSRRFEGRRQKCPRCRAHRSQDGEMSTRAQ